MRSKSNPTRVETPDAMYWTAGL